MEGKIYLDSYTDINWIKKLPGHLMEIKMINRWLNW